MTEYTVRIGNIALQKLELLMSMMETADGIRGLLVGGPGRKEKEIAAFEAKNAVLDFRKALKEDLLDSETRFTEDIDRFIAEGPIVVERKITVSHDDVVKVHDAIADTVRRIGAL